MTRQEWAKRFLDGIGAPSSDRNMEAMLAWMQVEYAYTYGGAVADFNPLNCTVRRPGSTDFNWVPVQNYKTVEDGIKAAIDTLLKGTEMKGPDGKPTDPFRYKPLLDALRRNFRPRKTLQRVGESAWGTDQELAKRVLRDVQRNPTPYREAQVGT